MFVLDSHCDTPTMMMRGRDIGIDNERGHVDLPKLKAGGVDASFFALYTSADLQPDAATRYALEMIGRIYDAVEANSGIASLAFSPDDALRNKAKGLVSIFIGMENGAPIQKSLPLLRVFHKLGVRYITLTHNGDNEIADSAAQGQRWHGLSPFGREVVAEMNRLGMIVDVSHLSDQGFYDVAATSSHPFVASHSNARSITGHTRNLTDDMIRILAEKGGVTGLTFARSFLAEPPNCRVEDMVRHVKHIYQVGGIDVIAIGSDFDGTKPPLEVANSSEIGKLITGLAKAGFSDEDLEKICYLNAARVIREVLG